MMLADQKGQAFCISGPYMLWVTEKSQIGKALLYTMIYTLQYQYIRAYVSMELV